MLTHDAALEQFLRSYRAADPIRQAYCEGAMRYNETQTISVHPDARHRSSPTTSQAGQDVFVWRNLFSAMTARGEKGFYVESGSNDACWGSNTFFFDRCLGWKGLCVEAQSKYWRSYRGRRTCQLVGECIADRHSQLTFTGRGARAGLARSRLESPNPHAHAGRKVQCSPLISMIRRVPEGQLLGGRDGKPVEVTFWSLDVEGAEMLVLNGTLGNPHLHVRVIMLEDSTDDPRGFERFMNARSYVKVQLMQMDALYVHTADVAELIPVSFWYGAGLMKGP